MLKKGIILLSIFIVGCSVRRIDDNYYTTHGGKTVYVSSDESRLSKDRVNLYGKYPKDNIAVARRVPYLHYLSDTTSPKEPIKKYTESEFLNFYKNLKATGYGDNSSYWRWNFILDKNQINKVLNKNLYSLGRRKPNDVLTLENGKWIKKSLKTNPVGTLKSMQVLQRGKSGVIIKLMIEGTGGTYLLAKEGNARALFGLSRSVVGDKVVIRGSKNGDGKYLEKPISTNPSAIPSGFFAFEKNSKGGYNFYGGGYGHGVGMPQWTASDLTKNHGQSYKKVLSRYYVGAKLKSISSVKGIGKNIRVGIMTTGFKSLDHSKITLYSTSGIKIRSKGGNVNVGARTNVDFVSKDGYTEVIVGGKRKLRTKHYVSVTSSKMISVKSISRGVKKYAHPTYRGSFEIRQSSKTKGRLRLINQVSIEDYLLQVVPSEMPAYFGIEALKAQAVAARTYAAKDIVRNRYGKDGFHIVDSTQSQVYNNLDENESTTKAVKATRNLVLLHNDLPIDAKYYSTTSGFNEFAENVW